MTAIDVSGLTAFDVHTHVHRSVRACRLPESGREDMGEYFGIGTMARYTVPELADYYRQRNMACVTFTVDSISQTGEEPVPDNFEIAELAAEHADVLIPFASIDPARGAAGVRQARRLITDFGVRGFKFHPGTQAFYPNDRMAYPLYEVIQEHGLVALFHTGQTGVGAGTRGGGGIRLKYSNPLHVDDVAVDFPDLTSSWPTRHSPGRTRRCRSPPTSRGSTSTCPAGRRSTSPPSWCSTRAACCGTRCCSAPTSRSSRRSAGSRTSRN